MSGIAAVIPARAGSKGVPNKNIKLLAGNPLLAYSIAAARSTKSVDRVIVSTDSEYYADIARKYGAEVPFLRPSEISGDNNTDFEWIKHMLDWMRKEDETLPNYLVHLRPTTPLRAPIYIEKAIQCLKKDKEATALRSVHEMSESAYKTVEVDQNYLKCICSGSFDLDAANMPRQTFPKTYITNGYVDIYRSFYILDNEKLLGDKVIPYITPCAFEIDTLEDFDYLEFLAEKTPELIGALLTKNKT